MRFVELHRKSSFVVANLVVEKYSPLSKVLEKKDVDMISTNDLIGCPAKI